MARFDIESAIVSLNQRLKDACVAVTVEASGSKLVMRSTLPKKPSDGVGRKQYRISIGISANREGIKIIEQQAHELSRQVQNEIFDWKNWGRSRTPNPDEMPVSQLLERFKEHYLSEHTIKESTWRLNALQGRLWL